MARLTNAQLVAQLEAAHISYEKLSIEHNVLQQRHQHTLGELALAQHTTTALAANTKPLPAKYLRYQPTAEAVVAHDAYAARCAAARALAMRGGVVVRVCA